MVKIIVNQQLAQQVDKGAHGPSTSNTFFTTTENGTKTSLKTGDL